MPEDNPVVAAVEDSPVIRKDYLRVSGVPIYLPAKLGFHHVRKRLGVFLGISAVPVNRPLNVAVAEVVPLQSQGDMSKSAGLVQPAAVIASLGYVRRNQCYKEGL
mgnify:CR=1 FL=1